MSAPVTSTTPHWVYTFRGAEGVVLYVGCTGNLPKRIREHALDKPWFAEVTGVSAEVHPDRSSGLAAETKAIKLLRPVHEKSADNLVRDVDNSPRIPCRRCRRGIHRECLGVNRYGEPCTCGCCRAARAAEATS